MWIFCIELNIAQIAQSVEPSGVALKILFGCSAQKPNIAQIAQSVEQRIENPRVGGSIPPLGTIIKGVFENSEARAFAHSFVCLLSSVGRATDL